MRSAAARLQIRRDGCLGMCLNRRSRSRVSEPFRGSCPLNGMIGIFVNPVCVVKTLTRSGPRRALGLRGRAGAAEQGREVVPNPGDRQLLLLGAADIDIVPHHETAGNE